MAPLTTETTTTVVTWSNPLSLTGYSFWLLACGLVLVWVILRAAISECEEIAQLENDERFKLSGVWYTIQTLIPVGIVGCVGVVLFEYFLG